jgi:hypothetical protein
MEEELQTEEEFVPNVSKTDTKALQEAARQRKLEKNKGLGGAIGAGAGAIGALLTGNPQLILEGYKIGSGISEMATKGGGSSGGGGNLGSILSGGGAQSIMNLVKSFSGGKGTPDFSKMNKDQIDQFLKANPNMQGAYDEFLKSGGASVMSAAPAVASSIPVNAA